MPTAEPPVVAPEIISPRPRADECYYITEGTQRAVATWCGGGIGIHGVGVFCPALDGIIPIGDWLVKENHPDGTIRWVTYTPELFEQLYDQDSVAQVETEEQE